MKLFRFNALLSEKGWLAPAFVVINPAGTIQSISGQPPSNVALPVEDVPFLGIPGFPNAHSHAFQYAMAGRAEGTISGHEADDFWSWRHHMYELALNVSPEAVESIAAYVYSQMLCLGYTAVAEFHYIHHDPKGNLYSDPGELSKRLLSAAEKAGIDITLIPIYYRTSNFGQAALPEQRRFISKGTDAFFRIMESVSRVIGNYPNARLGIGVHSLRAAPIEEVKEIFSSGFSSLPAHIHISEQLAEVNACISAHKKRPVELLFDTIQMTERMNLVHCTHIDAHEIELLAKSKVNVVICPTTEANLGDGFFPFVEFLQQGGHFSIGSDSQIALCFRRELQLLDYGQRLLMRRRNISCMGSDQESGTALFWNALITGQQALSGKRDTPLSIGQPLNVLLVDEEQLADRGIPGSKFLSALIFSYDHKVLAGTICRGNLVVKSGRHLKEADLFSSYRDTITGLFSKARSGVSKS
jgi:formimidoylglutamate deiminase